MVTVDVLDDCVPFSELVELVEFVVLAVSFTTVWLIDVELDVSV